MGPIGFSTGALAKSDFLRGISLQRGYGIHAIELSALRESEFDDLVHAVPTLDLEGFDYVSFHAPSRLEQRTEDDVVEKLLEIRERVGGIVVHPDIIENVEIWRRMGSRLLLENLDQRKRGCRTAEEMTPLFEALPDARFCFDIGHARQVDPTMSVAVQMLLCFRDRLAEIHISEVNEECRHVALSSAAVRAYQRVATLIPAEIPVIIESMIGADQIEKELAMTRKCFACGVRRDVVA